MLRSRMKSLIGLVLVLSLAFPLGPTAAQLAPQPPDPLA
jgi:hypothetical protein